MAETIIPTFAVFPQEGVIVGRLLAGYGELELELCACVAVISDNIDDVIRGCLETVPRGLEIREFHGI